MDFSRLRTGEIVAAAGGLALFVFLFFDWFGGGPTFNVDTLEETGISGWDALVDLPGFLIMLAGVSGIALAALAASGRRLNLPMPRGAGTAALGSLAVALILWRMVAGSPSLKIGIFLGLAAAVAIAVGAIMALREDGIEPLVSVPGGRTRAVSTAASAPAATAVATPPQSPPGTSVSSRSTRSSGGSTKTRSNAGGSTKTKSRSGARKTTARSGAKKTTARRGARKTTTRSGARKTTTRAKSSGSSTKSRSGSSKRSSGSRSSRSTPRSSGTRRRSSRK
jgi:hypothetical protein